MFEAFWRLVIAAALGYFLTAVLLGTLAFVIGAVLH